MYVVVNYFINEVILFFNNCLMCGNCSWKLYVDGFSVFSLLNLLFLLEVGINIELSINVKVDEKLSGEFKVNLIML